jgi:hypothetical protein
MSTHKCPGPECDIQVDHDLLACPRHWYQVPKAIRSEVYAAWWALQRAHVPDPSSAEQRHDLAVAAAIAEMSA